MFEELSMLQQVSAIREWEWGCRKAASNIRTMVQCGGSFQLSLPLTATVWLINAQLKDSEEKTNVQTR